MKSISPLTSATTAPSASTASVAAPGSSITVVVPLQVSISLGTPVVAPAPALGAAPTSAVAVPRIVPAVPVSAEGLFAPAPPQVALGRFALASLTAAAFDWHAALSLALASKVAYEDDTGVTNVAQGTWNFPQCQIVKADDTFCFVASSPDAVLVSFRGTADFGNWLTDLNAVGTTRPYGVVHRGFLAAFRLVDAQLRDALAGLGARKLLLTGHSLGGALATIAAAEWQGVFPISCIYTYGQPAVGMVGFPAFMAQHYAGKFFRFVNNNDLIPRVPPGYRHVGQLFHFDAVGDLEDTLEAAARALVSEAVPIFDSPARPPMLTQTEFDLLRAQLLQQKVQARTTGLESLALPTLEGFPSISDHAIDRYVAKIAAKAP